MEKSPITPPDDPTAPGKLAATEERLLDWLESKNILANSISALRGDVSPRRYFRVERDGVEPVILAAYPSRSSPELKRFLETSHLFAAAGIRIPSVLASDAQAGLMLLEDLGTDSVFDLPTESWSELELYIEDAIEALSRLAEQPVADFERINPLLDVGRLTTEILDAQQVFLASPGFSGEVSERRELDAALDMILRALAAEPLVPSHRDFMSRNLMLPPDGSGPAVIDHQDACLAPRFYDLASLLNDSLFLSPTREEALLGRIATDRELFLSYRRCAVQRTLKAAATYVKFAHRGFDRHLPLIAPTLARTASHIERLPEGRSLPKTLLARWRDPQAINDAVDRIIKFPRERS